MASPAALTSGPRSRAPDRARYVPKEPGQRRLRKWEPPTSQKSPRAVSGIATSVRSVATRNGPCMARPQPPPMQIPSMTATCGFDSLPIKLLRWYSARKNASESAGRPARAPATAALTSPPAQNAFPPAPLMRMAWTCGWASHCAYSSCSRPTTPALIAFSCETSPAGARPHPPTALSAPGGSGSCGKPVPLLPARLARPLR